MIFLKTLTLQVIEIVNSCEKRSQTLILRKPLLWTL